MAFSTYLADAILQWLRTQAFPTALSNVYISLHSAAPGNNGTSADVTASITGSASRTQLASSNLGAPTAGSTGLGRQVANTNTATITSNAVNPTTIQCTHFGLWDAATGGNFLYSGVLDTATNVSLGNVVQFSAGSLVIRNT